MKTFSCKKCSFTGESPTILREHDRKVHLKKGKEKFSSTNHACKLCAYTYSRTISLSRHMKTVHDKKDEKKGYVSHVGNKKGVRKNPVKAEVSKETNEKMKKLACYNCSFQGCNPAQLRDHFRKDHSKGNKTNAGTVRLRNNYLCGKCNSCLMNEDCGVCRFCKDKPKFGGPNTLRKKCMKRVCQNAQLPTQPVSKEEHNKVEKLACENCSFQGDSAAQLRDHIKKDHSKDGKDDVYECKFCNYTYSRISSLSRHLKTIHLTVYDFKCEMCECQTQDLKQLLRHKESVHRDKNKKWDTNKKWDVKKCEFAMMSQEGIAKVNKRKTCKAKVSKVTKPSLSFGSAPQKRYEKESNNMWERNPMSTEIRQILEDLIKDLPCADVLANSAPKEDENKEMRGDFSGEGNKKRGEDGDKSEVSKLAEREINMSEPSSTPHVLEECENEQGNADNNLLEDDRMTKNDADKSEEAKVTEESETSMSTPSSPTCVPSSAFASEEHKSEKSEETNSKEGNKKDPCQSKVSEETERLDTNKGEKEKDTNYFECNQCKYATMNMEEFEFHIAYMHITKDTKHSSGRDEEEDKKKVGSKKGSKRKRKNPGKTEKSKSNESGYFSSESVSEKIHRKVDKKVNKRRKKLNKEEVFKVKSMLNKVIKTEVTEGFDTKMYEQCSSQSFSEDYEEEEEGKIEFCDLCDFGSEAGDLKEHMMSSHMTDYYTRSCLGFSWQFFNS